MYLHLGADCMIKNTDIIAIFNIRDQQSEIYDNYISVNKDKYKIIDLSENGECSSCILTTDTLYLSGISALTLKRRAEEDFGSDAIYKSLRDNMVPDRFRSWKVWKLYVKDQVCILAVFLPVVCIIWCMKQLIIV